MSRDSFIQGNKVLGMTRILVLLVLLMACAPTRQMAQEPKAGEEDGLSVLGTPMLPSIHEAEALAADASWYANRFNVPLEEALRRLELQESIGELNARLSEQQLTTFAGLWIEHEPDFKVVVAFTENGKETLQPYIHDQPYEDYVEVRTYRYTLAELETAQQQGMAIAEQLGVSVSGGIDVEKNQATLVVGNPELLLDEIRAAGITLPEAIEILAIVPNSLTDTNRGGVLKYTLPDEEVIYFPKQPPQEFYPEGNFEGVVALDEQGCLRLENWGVETPLILWRHDLVLHFTGHEIEVHDDKGEMVMHVGEPVQIGGGLSDTVHISGMPLPACPGPYLQLGVIDILEVAK